MYRQILQTQGAMQELLLEGYVWSFEKCTGKSSGPQLSSKERRCIQQGIATFFAARSHVGQQLEAHMQASSGGY